MCENTLKESLWWEKSQMHMICKGSPQIGAISWIFHMAHVLSKNCQGIFVKDSSAVTLVVGVGEESQRELIH